MDLPQIDKTKQVALFSMPFRPFFLGAVLFFIISAIIWLYQSYGSTSFLNDFPLNAWHAHEMIYGYCMAVIAGFLLTASANWTTKPAIKGTGLVLLFTSWLLARVSVLFDGPVLVIALFDSGFSFGLSLILFGPIFHARQWHNQGLVLLVFCLGVFNLIFYLGSSGLVENGVFLGLQGGVYGVLLIIAVMARRVIPFFIEKGLTQTGTIDNRLWLDRICLWGLLLLGVAEVLASDSLILAICVILLPAYLYRLLIWHHPGIWKQSLLWMLYIGYACFPLAFVLKLLSVVFPVSPFLSLHAFTTGVIGLITVGMMCRVSLAHTGRNVSKPPAQLKVVFVLLLIGVGSRVLLPLVFPVYSLVWMGAAMFAWMFGLVVLLWLYFPVWTRPNLH